MTKKMKRLFSVMLIVSVMMSMLSVSAFAEDTVPETSFFQCGYAAEHIHTGEDGDCYKTELICNLHVHGETCYTDGVLTCTNGAWDPACELTAEHP